jgi:hypothetical protein
MCKNELFQSSGTKNELFKVQGRKTKLMYSLKTKTIFWPKFYNSQLFQIMSRLKRSNKNGSLILSSIILTLN